MLRIAMILAALSGQAYATPEYVLPTLFDVTGVASDDVLNIRAAPEAGAEIIGSFAPNAKNIEVVAEQKGWSQVDTGEQSGWVSSRYLNYQTEVWEPGKLPDSFSCYGTEPFWNVKLKGNQLVLGTPDSEDDSRNIQTVLDTGAFRHPMRAVVAEGMTLTATPQQCSDGMSDRTLGLAAHVIIHGDKPRMLTGCCSIQP